MKFPEILVMHIAEGRVTPGLKNEAQERSAAPYHYLRLGEMRGGGQNLHEQKITY